ncbi:MAG: zinc ribbon domain-containing protein [Thermoplasmata archaeon]
MTSERKKPTMCPHCGARVSGQQGTCPKCGRKLTGTARLKCPYCGNPVLQSETTCSVCGTSLPKVVKKPPAKGKSERAKPGKEAPPPKKKPSAPKDQVDDRPECPVCGSKVSATDTHCGSCGVEFEPEEEDPEGKPPPPAEPAPKGGFVVVDTESAECPVCGSIVSLDADKCPKCGIEFETEGPEEGPIPQAQEEVQAAETAAEDEEQAECPICGTASSVSNKSCPFCGAEFETEAPAPTEVTFPSATPVPLAVDIGEGVSCPVCGEIVGTSLEACPRCGAEFEPEVVTEQPPEPAPEVAPLADEEEVLCPVCGKSVGASVSSCPYCGVEFEEEEEQETQASMFVFKPPKGIVRPPPGRTWDSRRGVSNGASAINGVSLVNGVGQLAPPSRVNGLGATNGMDLVNGRGRSNGGAVNGRRPGARGRHRVTLMRWQLIAIFVAFAILIPAIYFATVGEDGGPFSIDGDFDDWEAEARLTTILSASSPSIDVVEWSVATYEDTLYLYVETESPMMAGETVEGFVLFIDTDGSEETGYDLAEFGADAMIELQGWNGSLSVSLCSSFGSSDDRLDWNSWAPRCGVACSFDGSRLEASADMSATLTGTSRVLLASLDESGPGCRSSPVPIEGGLLIVEQIPSEDITADGVLELGTDVVVSTLRFSCVRAGGVVDSVSPELVGVELLDSVDQFSIGLGEEFTVDLRADTSSILPGQFVSMVVTSDGVQSSFAQTHVVGDGAKAYVGAPPEDISVDGAFADWIGMTMTDVDAEPVENPNIDIDEVGGANGTDMSYFFVSVKGEMLAGAYVPGSCSKPMTTGSGTAVPARRTGEDFMRFYIDSDRSSSTGYGMSAGSMMIGADYLIAVSGLFCEVEQAGLSEYVNGGWEDVDATIDVGMDETRMEMGVASEQISGSGQFEFIVISTDWRKGQDLALFIPEEDTGTRLVSQDVFAEEYNPPQTENIPEFGDIAVPVVLMLVTFVLHVRRRRPPPVYDNSAINSWLRTVTRTSFLE